MAYFPHFPAYIWFYAQISRDDFSHNNNGKNKQGNVLMYIPRFGLIFLFYFASSELWPLLFY